MTKDYTVTFANATAIPWCPGELHDGQYGHYDLNLGIASQTSLGLQAQCKLRHFLTVLGSNFRAFGAGTHNA